MIPLPSPRALAVALVFVLGLCRPVAAQTVDHHAIAQFDVLTDAQIAAAAALRFSYIGRSVGFNINAGLDCLSTPKASAPFSCTKNQTEQWTKSYPRGQWSYLAIPGVGIQHEEASCEKHDGEWPGYQECGETTQQWVSGINVKHLQYDYLSNLNASNPLAGYFTARSGFPSDVFDFEAWVARSPTVKFLLGTTSLTRADCSSPGLLARLHAFNVQMRTYAALHPEFVLVDYADILSHAPDGTPSTDPTTGFPNISAAYTTEACGGHPNAVGKVRLAKALWVALVRIADGGIVLPPPDLCVSDPFTIAVTWPASPAVRHVTATDSRGCTVEVVR